MIALDASPFRASAGLPARLNAEQAAALLGFQAHDIPALIAAGLLSPLGRVAKGRNAVKYFALVDIEERRRDPKWLSRATDAAYERFARRNGETG
ncbi:MAG: hypothetical protein IT580_16490 [Verrucomicrobiales bacterium]|nr:hypothetical protein [Verrucomicrobiales bacterium]